jgi:hypothetical protein
MVPGWAGMVSSVMTTVSLDGVQTPLLIVQRSLFVPAPIPVNPDVGEEGVVMVAVPETRDHDPVPRDGVLAARVAVLTHMF